jgi:hypothetical protein
MSPSVEDDGENGEEMTLYFDAEEGTLRTSDGHEVSFEESEESTADGEEQTEEEEGQGSRTPQPTAAAEGAHRPVQISGMSHPTTRRRPSLGRRFSHTMRRRVSRSLS